MKRQILSLIEVETLIWEVRLSGRKNDLALILGIIFCGGEARVWTWGKVAQADADFPSDVYNVLRELARVKNLSLSLSPRDFLSKNGNDAILNQAIFSASGKLTPLTTQDVTRRIKRHARRAGIQKLVNLRVLANTSRVLRKQFGSAVDASNWLLHRQFLGPYKTKNVYRTMTSFNDPRLHGIGRRTK